jgi:hypothetical protein
MKLSLQAKDQDVKSRIGRNVDNENANPSESSHYLFNQHVSKANPIIN